MSEYELYEVLGCCQSSSYEELKKNYRKLVLQHHPDKVDSSKDQSTDTFRKIEEAWKVLRDPKSRLKYDAICKQAELELQSVLVYATITPSMMQATADAEMLSYECRCGSYYLMDKYQLDRQKCNIEIPCQECTFVLVVET